MIYNFFDEKYSSSAATRARSETVATRDKSAIKSEILPKQQKGPLPKICHTYSTTMKVDTAIPYPKKIQKA